MYSCTAAAIFTHANWRCHGTSACGSLPAVVVVAATVQHGLLEPAAQWEGAGGRGLEHEMLPYVDFVDADEEQDDAKSCKDRPITS